MAEPPVFSAPYKSQMTDSKYMLTLPADIQSFFKNLSNTDISQCSGKTAIMALNMAQRRPFIAFTKSGGQFYNKSMIADEVKRLLKLKPISLEPLPCCDFCQRSVEEDDQAWSKDRTLCIHMDCDDDWSKKAGYDFPYEGNESDSEVDDLAYVFTTPSGQKVWRTVADPEDPDWGVDDCYVWEEGVSWEDCGAYLGKYCEAEGVIKKKKTSRASSVS